MQHPGERPCPRNARWWRLVMLGLNGCWEGFTHLLKEASHHTHTHTLTWQRLSRWAAEAGMSEHQQHDCNLASDDQGEFSRLFAVHVHKSRNFSSKLDHIRSKPPLHLAYVVQESGRCSRKEVNSPTRARWLDLSSKRVEADKEGGS